MFAEPKNYSYATGDNKVEVQDEIFWQLCEAFIPGHKSERLD